MGRADTTCEFTAGGDLFATDVLAGIPAHELLAELRDARAAENRAVFRQLRVIAALHRAFRPDEARRAADRRLRRRDTSAESLHESLVVTDAAVALKLTEAAAGRRVDGALALLVEARLPETALLARLGVLDWSRINVLVMGTRDLTAEQARAVERLVLTRGVLDLTLGRFQNEVDRAVLTVDAEALERRRTAARADRKATFWKVRDGSGALDGRAELLVSGPAEALRAAWNAVDAAARWLRKGGDPRTLDQLRHDLVVTGCTAGALPVPQDVLPERPLGQGSDERARGAHGRRATQAGGAPSGNAVMPDERRTPCDAAMPGPGEASSDAGALGDEAGSEGGLLPDGGARPYDGGAASEEPGALAGGSTFAMAPRPDVPVRVTVTVALETLLGLNEHPALLDGYGPITAAMARDLAANGIWRCAAVDDTHGTVLGLGRSTFTPGYVPGANLREFVTVAAPTCQVPWCNAAAENCDLDHRVPHAEGGATCVCTVGPLCRRHHRQKSAGSLRGEASTDPLQPPGTVVWTTHGGQRVVVLPYSPLPPEAYLAAPEGRVGPAGRGIATRRPAPHLSDVRVAPEGVPEHADRSRGGAADRAPVVDEPAPF